MNIQIKINQKYLKTNSYLIICLLFNCLYIIYNIFSINPIALFRYIKKLFLFVISKFIKSLIH